MAIEVFYFPNHLTVHNLIHNRIKQMERKPSMPCIIGHLFGESEGNKT